VQAGDAEQSRPHGGTFPSCLLTGYYYSVRLIAFFFTASPLPSRFICSCPSDSSSPIMLSMFARSAQIHHPLSHNILFNLPFAATSARPPPHHCSTTLPNRWAAQRGNVCALQKFAHSQVCWSPMAPGHITPRRKRGFLASPVPTSSKRALSYCLLQSSPRT
jgi:hypothetical protein